jgi:hypothetical protein
VCSLQAAEPQLLPYKLKGGKVPLHSVRVANIACAQSWPVAQSPPPIFDPWQVGTKSHRPFSVAPSLAHSPHYIFLGSLDLPGVSNFGCTEACHSKSAPTHLTAAAKHTYSQALTQTWACRDNRHDTSEQPICAGHPSHLADNHESKPCTHTMVLLLLLLWR